MMEQIEMIKTQPTTTRNQTYTVEEIAAMLKLSRRKAYDLCAKTSDFKVIHIGRCVRVNKISFDEWFEHGGEG